MKQKIVIKMKICCDKCRSEALKIAAVADGVISVALEGDDKEKVVVIGEKVDAVSLTGKLRKKFNCVSLESVEEVKPPKPKEGKKEKKKEKKESPKPCSCTPDCQYPPRCELYKVVYDPNPTTCTIM